jgi:hypothetical protein
MMIELSESGKKFLKDAANNPLGTFKFIQVASGGWQTSCGNVNDPQECLQIKTDLEILVGKGFMRELKPGGGLFEITPSGREFAKT